MRFTVIYPLGSTPADPLHQDYSYFLDRFRSEVGQVEDVQLELQKAHEQTVVGPAENWSVVVSGWI